MRKQGLLAQVTCLTIGLTVITGAAITLPEVVHAATSENVISGQITGINGNYVGIRKLDGEVITVYATKADILRYGLKPGRMVTMTRRGDEIVAVTPYVKKTEVVAVQRSTTVSETRVESRPVPVATPAPVQREEPVYKAEPVAQPAPKPAPQPVRALW
jgi:hypothetical protein